MREAREVEYAAEIQRVISVDMDMEQRLAIIVEDLLSLFPATYAWANVGNGRF